MRSALSLLAATLAAAVTGCGVSGDGQSDCAVQVRYQGITYQDVGFSSRPATKSATKAVQAGCAENGKANGPTFERGTFETEVWTFPGYPDTLGVPLDDDTYRVLAPLTASEAFLTQLHVAGLFDPGDQ